MTINQIKYFIAVYEIGSILKASKECYVSQPAISQSILSLEREFQLNLFQRSGKTLINTTEGQFFYEKAKKILEDVNLLENRMKEISNGSNILRIGVPPMIGSFLFPDIFLKFCNKNPKIEFSILESGSLHIRNRIEDKNIDLALTILDKDRDEFYNTIQIMETELYFCVSKKNPLSNKKILTINDIKDESLILMKEGSFQNPFIHTLFKTVNVKPKVILYSSQLNTMKKFVSYNAGSAFLFKELIDKNDPDIVGIPLSEEFKIKIGLIWPINSKPEKNIIKFINFIKKYKYKEN
ncbi:MAG: LysR family transcriptional regulator [Acholeplasmatales bacterium]|jgi:DNA-binding transcriptional LysR family regulator|nr:LysR family transcriptional regulator [Acholeplasmatales bacterium]